MLFFLLLHGPVILLKHLPCIPHNLLDQRHLSRSTVCQHAVDFAQNQTARFLPAVRLLQQQDVRRVYFELNPSKLQPDRGYAYDRVMQYSGGGAE